MTSTPWGLRLREILADGQWHSREELVVAAGPFVPPGRAIRIRESAATHSNSSNVGDQRDPERRGTGPRPERSIEFKLAVGRRRVIVDTLWQWNKSVERRTEKGTTFYRLRR